MISKFGCLPSILFYCLVKMNGENSVFVDKFVGNNYSYWNLCTEAYLQRQDLWDLISSNDVVILEDTLQNVELRRK